MRGPELNSRDTPCHHCKDRYTACSDYCQKPEFIAWKEEQARIKKARQQYRPPGVETGGKGGMESGEVKVLVACEESQEVCKAFRELGHEAYSCDIQECSGGHPEWHIQGDALMAIRGGTGDHHGRMYP